MKRMLAAAVLLLAAVAGIYGYVVTAREQAFREHVDRGESALARDDTFAAVEAFSAAIAVQGGSMIGYLKRGETYLRRDELEAAMRRPMQLEPLAPRPHLDAALRDLRRASDIDPNAPRPFELLGDVNYALGRYERAADQYRRYVALDERSPRILYKLALSSYAARRPAAAMVSIGRALAMDDGFAEAYYLKGLCARDLQKPKEALAALERAVRLAPAMLQAREELATLYGRLGRTDDRIAMLEALGVLDASPSRQVVLGLAYARAGRTDRAVMTLGAAAERYPDYAYTYVALGRVWLDIAQSRGDRVALGKALEALTGRAGTENSSEALTVLGRALLLAGDEPRAERMLQQATETLPADPRAFYHLADASARRARFDVARQALLDYRALEQEPADRPQDAAVMTRIADYSSRLGDHAGALTWYARAMDAGATGTPVLLRAAEAHARTGDLQAARAMVARAIEKDPLNRAARQLERRLR